MAVPRVDLINKKKHVEAVRSLREHRTKRASRSLSDRAKHDQLLAAVRTLYKREKNPRLKAALRLALRETKDYERLRVALKKYKSIRKGL